MEGDHSSAGLMIAEYNYILDFLKGRATDKLDPEIEFQSMSMRMIKKSTTYLDEALGCDAILIARMLHPSYQLSMFQVSFPTYHDYAQTLLQDIYDERKKEINDERKKEIEESQGPKKSAPLISSQPPSESNHRQREGKNSQLKTQTGASLGGRNISKNSPCYCPLQRITLRAQLPQQALSGVSQLPPTSADVIEEAWGSGPSRDV
ncbi:hypothetical protein PCASD_12201 [Puccinia coronata f. sp. avenae]|uniref:Uncharacterized protein n=1 Tax=Puccinia coronata f. sp. avenae TaxID=200324 RepID=A0A2N5UIV7_9BASI|nr:hypothetical protein PCASD_12201 [Puccinia coronata f. sp. avenae]